VNLSVDNLFGISDMFNIGVNSDANREGNQRGTAGQNLYYAVPFGFWYYSLSASNSDYHKEIAGTGQHIVSSGKSKNLDIKTSYLFQRDQYQKNSLNVNFGKQWAHAFIDNTEIDVQKRDVTFVEFGWTHKHYFDQNQLDLTIAQRCGTSWFGGQSDAPDRTSDYPTYQYTLQTIDASLSVPFQLADQPLTLNTTLRGQTTRSPLYLTDQFSIGGRYTVRGFDGELTLAAERGFYWRNELDMPIANSTSSAYLGIDVGKVYGKSVPLLIGDELAGIALGLRGAYKNFSYDVFTSWPLYKPKQYSTAEPYVGFNFTVQF
jgi:hemolysin activation/secretion protein